MRTHVIMFSGGAGSYLTAKRVKVKYPDDRVVLLFADVGGENPHAYAGEHADTYRFIHQAAELLDLELHVVADGRDIWQVFKDDRFLGNARLANCSKFLKQQPCRKWLETNHPDEQNTVVHVGIDWSEEARMDNIRKGWAPYPVESVMLEPPLLDKQQMIAELDADGLTLPVLYQRGFAHNNCGGFCVRSGQAQFLKLLQEDPDRYDYHEQREQEIRDHLDKNVAILRDRRGEAMKDNDGKPVPLTLRDFRLRVVAQGKVDTEEWGGCGCFVGDDPELTVEQARTEEQQ